MSKARDLAGIFNLNPTSGTTAQRPATADVGDIFYNGTTGKTQIYTPTGWQDMASGIPYGNTAGRPAAVTGQPYFNGEQQRLELYASAGWQNIVSETPGVLSISGNYLESVGSATISITGTNFTTGAIASATGTNGVEVNATSTTVNSIVSVTAVFSGLSAAYEPYSIKVTNTSNLFGLLPNALYINQSPIWQTSSGSLGSFNEQVSITLSALSATDSDSTTITYALASGSTLPSGVTLNSSTGVISGTLPDIATDTTYSFTVNATDGLNVIPRTFSITSKYLIPVEYLVVAGGGSGGGGYFSGGGGAGETLSGGATAGTANTGGGGGGRRPGSFPRPIGCGHGPREGPRHLVPPEAQLRHGPSGRLPQGGAADGHGRAVRPAGAEFRGHGRRLSGRGRRGARPGGGHCAFDRAVPDAEDPQYRDHHWRGRFGRRDRAGGHQPGADAGTLHLFSDLAGRRGVDPVAGRVAGQGCSLGDEDHRRRPSAAEGHRQGDRRAAGRSSFRPRRRHEGGHEGRRLAPFA